MSLKSPTLNRIDHSENLYYLTEGYYLREYWSKSLKRYVNIYVPQYNIVNGCSIPRFFWRLFHPLESKFWVAFVVHDYLYGSTDLSTPEKRMTRKEVDLLFYDLLRTEGVGWTKAKTMYTGVRSGGWASFRKNPNEFYV